MKPPPVYARAARRRGRVAKPSGSCTSSGATRRSGPSSPPKEARDRFKALVVIQETFYDFELSTAFTKAINDRQLRTPPNRGQPGSSRPVIENPTSSPPFPSEGRPVGATPPYPGAGRDPQSKILPAARRPPIRGRAVKGIGKSSP